MAPASNFNSISNTVCVMDASTRLGSSLVKRLLTKWLHCSKYSCTFIFYSRYSREDSMGIGYGQNVYMESDTRIIQERISNKKLNKLVIECQWQIKWSTYESVNIISIINSIRHYELIGNLHS
ncbi:hypothetical protein MTR67_045104 [Solanum verrucosum]|uniref:Uncharacterized protein n=1 Tax=Solanum verrucosum TaxID=315347 RepID=A0AAF0UUN5_SOLVR|nr:hypothetical protein MTR67_045104 [Solanum verrucosum]